MMPFLATLTDAETTLWTVTIGIAAVVIAVVILLLTFLINLVNVIDRNVSEVWNTATRLAANTATVWQVTNTSATLERLNRELQLHDQLLGA